MLLSTVSGSGSEPIRLPRGSGQARCGLHELREHWSQASCDRPNHRQESCYFVCAGAPWSGSQALAIGLTDINTGNGMGT